MKTIVLLIITLGSTTTFAVSGGFLAGALRYAYPDFPHTIFPTARTLANVIAPRTQTFRRAEELRIAAAPAITTFQFVPRIAIAGGSSDLLEEFLRVLQGLDTLESVEISEAHFTGSSFQRLIDGLSSWPLRRLVIRNSREIPHELVLRLPLGHFREIDLSNNELTIDMNALFRAAPSSQRINLEGNAVTGFLDLRALPRNLVSLRGPPGLIQPSDIENLMQNTAIMNSMALAEYLLQHFGSLSHSEREAFTNELEQFLRDNPTLATYQYPGDYNLLMLIATDIGWRDPAIAERLLTSLIGDGNNSQLHRQNRDGWTLAMLIARHIGDRDPARAERLLRPLIGNGSNPQLHVQGTDSWTLAMFIARNIGWRDAERAERLLMLLIGDGSNPRLYLQNSDGRTLAMFIARYIGERDPERAERLLAILRRGQSMHTNVSCSCSVQ